MTLSRLALPFAWLGPAMGTARDSSIDFGLVMHCNWCANHRIRPTPMLSEYVDRGGNHLGYLKREVADWFANKLDRGESFSACVYRKHNDGALISGVFEH